MRTLLTLTVVALAFPVASAAGGGWATAGLAPPPADVAAGDTWRAEINLLQHGVTPLEGVEPTLTITGPVTRTFTAKPTGEPGVYVAEVVFPVAGTYAYQLDDGFTQTHTFKPVEIGPAAAAAPPVGDDGFPVWGIAPIALAALGLAGLTLLALRRRPVPISS